MKINIYALAAGSLLLSGLTACMEFDNPSDEFAQNETVIDATVYSGDADKLDYEYQPTEEEVDEAFNTFMDNSYFGNIGSACYTLLGSKDGVQVSPHAYQYHFSLTTDNYAGYTTMVNSSFTSGGFVMETTYTYVRNANEGPYGRLLEMKNYLGNPLNIDLANNIVEIKAICLLLFDHVALECTDLYGAIPLVDHKANKETNPFEFNRGVDIYATIIKNLDDINACLLNFNNRPDWYKDRINEALINCDYMTQDFSLESWRRYANSLKLRMAMNYVKFDPVQARKWAEEAVQAGVIETKAQEVGHSPNQPNLPYFGGHPLATIFNAWHDVGVNASFISMLTSLQHPYMEYLFDPTTDDLINSSTGDVFPAGSGIVGVRAGLRMLGSQQYFSNNRVAYSRMNFEYANFMPVYAFKLAEVEFLRAEGALRGWSMGGSAQEFYEEGIRHADCNLEGIFTDYEDRLDDYLEVENAVPFTYVDPMDYANNIESVTKIGVKWNDGDDMETKLEKIITQKYIAIYPYSYGAWTDMRRTGYPKIFPVLNPTLGNDGSLHDGDLIRRLILPFGDTQAGQEDVQNTGLDALGGPDLYATRVFWDIDQPNF